MPSFQSVDPRTGEVIAEHPQHDEAEVERRVAAAVAAQAAWARHTFTERAAVLNRAAELLRERATPLGERMTREMGKPIAEAEGEAKKCAWVCEHYAEHAEAFLAEQDAPSAAARSFVRFDPLGVILAVMPWNFPLWQVFRFGAPALMAGNAMLVKHAPTTLGCAKDIEDLMADAGLPDGLLQNLVVDVDRVPALIADRRIAAVTLTGSDRAGKAVASQAGASVKKAVLELGGSDPFIVLEDANLDAAVAGAVLSRTLNNGQSCIAAKRFLVVDAVADTFVRRLTEAVEALEVGDPMDRSVRIGPLAREDLRTALHAQVLRSIEAGAELRTGGEVPAGPGFFYPPTVLDHVGPGMAAFDEETFGPVAAVIRVRDADEAVALANRCRYGLAASVWTHDRERALDLAARIEAGGVFVNHIPVSDPRVPFGGIKDSGYGRELGEWGIREFVNVKTVWVD